MTLLSNLPNEILENIFNDFDDDELIKCQSVCKNWYSFIHVLLLKQDIYLSGATDIKKFIISIDSNPNSTYLNAVTTIVISNKGKEESGDYSDSDNSEEHKDREEDKNKCSLYRLGKEEVLQGLFFRFPNLKVVVSHGLLWLVQWLNDTLCNKFLESCPKLDEFDLRYDQKEIQSQHEYYCALDAAQPLITSFNIEPLRVYFHHSLEEEANYVAGFPRLKFFGRNHSFISFQDWCLVLEKHPSYPRVDITWDDLDDFMEDHLTGLSDIDRRKFIKRLSEVRYLQVELYTLPSNAMITACRYLTGLNYFIMHIYNCCDWDDTQKQIFCTSVLNLLPTVQQFGHIHLVELEFTFLSAIFADIVSNMFDGAPTRSAISNYLKLIVPSEEGTRDLLLRCCNRNQHRRHTLIEANDGLDSVVSSLFTKELDSVDSFELLLTTQYDIFNVDIYEKIFSRMPSLKEVILDVPGDTIRESIQFNEYSGSILSKVEDVTLKASMNLKFQALLDMFYFTFPNIQQLQICYSKHYPDRGLGVLDVALPKYSLKQLTLDLTPVTALKTPDDKYFFVIRVKFSNGRQHLFKVSLSSVIRIKGKDLDGLTLGKEYCLVRITVNSLTRLAVSLNYDKHRYDDIKNDYEERWKFEGIKTRLIRLDYSE